MTLHAGAMSHRQPEFKQPEPHAEQEAGPPLALEEASVFQAVCVAHIPAKTARNKGRQRFAHTTYRGTTGPRELCPAVNASRMVPQQNETIPDQ